MLQILILAVCLLFKGSISQLSHDGNKTADYGGDAHYWCALAIPTGVLQVTWQRLFKDESIENLATYSQRFGQQVNDPYRGKVIFTEASLSSTSITLKNVSWEDESCYICSFNVYPDGSQRRQTCLTVTGISKVNTSHVLSSGHEEDGEVVFSCSATGKPAPTMNWAFPSDATAIDQPQTTTVANSDHTFTSSGSITLKVPPHWDGHVDCLLNRGKEGQRRERISFSSRDEGGEAKEKGTGLPQTWIALLITAIIFIFFGVVAAVWRQKRRLGDKRRNEDEAVI